MKIIELFFNCFWALFLFPNSISPAPVHSKCPYTSFSCSLPCSAHKSVLLAALKAVTSLSRCSALDWTRQMLHLPVAAQRSFLWAARVPVHTHTHTKHTHRTHTHTLGYDVKSLVWHWSFYVNFYCSSLADFLLFLVLPQLMLLSLLLLALLFFVLLFFVAV